VATELDERDRLGRIGAALRELGDLFPEQCTDKVKRTYWETLRRRKYTADAIEKACARVTETWRTKKFPPLSAILDRLSDIARAERSDDRVELEKARLVSRDTSPEGIAADRANLKLLRSVSWPERSPAQVSDAPKPRRRNVSHASVPLKKLPPMTAKDRALMAKLDAEWRQNHNSKGESDTD